MSFYLSCYERKYERKEKGEYPKLWLICCLNVDLNLKLQVSSINAGPSQEVFSISFGGPGGNLIAAGCKSQVCFWL